MQAYLLKMLLEMVLKRLTDEQLKTWADMALDYLEDAVKESDTQVDDMLVLPLIDLIRDAFGIEDGED